MLLRCAIIDDDRVFTDILTQYISKVDFIELQGVYPDAATASAGIDFNRVDFLFLDVEMPGINGIEFLESLTVTPPVIFVSRNKEYGADAFDHDSIDYLHKPVPYARFLKAINKAKRFFSGHSKNITGGDSARIFVRHERMWIRIPVNDILYIKADNNDVVIKTHDKVYRTHSKLKDIYDQLPQERFFQVHRSYIVQLDKIEKVDGEVIEVNARTIPVSKTYLREMYRRLNISV
jgi:DNA-binding LytR/AlgR family response regulator